MSGPPDEALYQALLKADRSESLGPLAAGLAREFNDLLTRLLGAVHRAAGADAEALAQAERAGAEARDLMRRFAALAAGAEGQRAPVGARELLDRAVRLAAAGSAAEIAVHVPDDIPLLADAEQLGQAFRNLIRNAAEAMHPPPPRPRIQLRAAAVTLPEERVAGLAAGDYIEFEVRDNGCGIPPENLERMWEPFFTTKAHASGLGLPAAMAVIRRHGGQIGVDSVPGVGTVFTVYLPRRAPPGAVQSRPPPSERFRTGRILVVDDDAEIRGVAAAMLEKLDYKCDLAADGDEGLALYRRYLEIGRPHDAVLLDQTMPGRPGGDETLPRLRALDPDVRAIAVSGETAEDFARSRLEAGYRAFLAKPFRLYELAEVLKSVGA